MVEELFPRSPMNQGLAGQLLEERDLELHIIKLVEIVWQNENQ